MSTFYTLLYWLSILFYWLLVAGISVRVMYKRRPVTSTMTRLLIIYILPFIGIIAYLAFGELHLGRRRVEQAKECGRLSPAGLKICVSQNTFSLRKTVPGCSAVSAD